MDRLIWKNGEWLPENEAAVSLYDSAMMFGDSVFEMMRTFNRKTFNIEEHFDRLYNSAKYVDIKIPYDKKKLIDIHERLIAVSPIEGEVRTLINLSRGTLPVYEKIAPLGTNIIMTAFPLSWIVKGASEYYEKGVHAIITEQRQAKHIEAKVKNRSRLHYRLSELEAKRSDPAAWGILLDDYGNLAEGTGSNFFLVKDDRLFTPTTQSCLAGISRAYIIETAKLNNIVCSECDLDLYDVMTCDEAFFSNTPHCIVPITKLNFRQVGNGKVGEITKILSEIWEHNVDCAWREQAAKWDSQV